MSLSARFLINAEALNMVESVGNVARHRRAPLLVPTNTGEYVLVYAPVISGESLANAYQRWLATVSKADGLPVCSNCENHFFVKHGDREVFGTLPWEGDLAKKLGSLDFHDIERTIVENCVVEDFGGFLLPEERPVKRTSKFQVGFMVPAYEEVRKTALEAQFHVRYAPDPARHRIYYVELGSALYAFHFNLDLDGVGFTSMVRREEVVKRDDRVKRVRAGLKSLAQMIDNRLFGARLSRFTPAIELRSLLVTVSDPAPFTASPAHSRGFVDNTVKRAKAFLNLFGEGEVNMWLVDQEGLGVSELKEGGVSLARVSTASEALSKAAELVALKLR